MASKKLIGPRIINERVVKLRLEHNWTQGEFGKRLTELSPKDNEVSQSNISMWETRNRTISMVYLEPISQLFGVTTDYLLGLTDDEQGHYEEKTGDIYEKSQIKFWELYAFDRQPVYIDFGDAMIHENGWAIYNRQKDFFVLAEDIIKVSECEKYDVKYYVQDISRLYDPLQQRKPLSMQDMLEIDKVYIQMLSVDKKVRGLYDGWYHHNENRTALINNDGLVLPYEGLKKAYNAYAYRQKITERIKEQ